VEDASGAAVSGATVTVKNVETGAIRTSTTDDTGNFRILSLNVGPQEVKAEKSGFKTAVRSGVNLVVGQEALVNLQLEIGEVTQIVSGRRSAARRDDRASPARERAIKKPPVTQPIT
jgi:transcriptional regulator of nitric oxide reductase